MNTKNHIISLLLLLVASIGQVTAQVQIGSLFYNLDANSLTATVTSNPDGKYAGDIIIPSTVEYEASTYNVTSVGWSAFDGCSNLTSVTIPNSVTSIENYAFHYCSSLTSIEIPNSVTSIGGHAFYGCKGLTSVTIPNSITSIGICTFEECSGLTSVTIPNSITSIGISAFYGCSGLTSVTIPNSVTSIGGLAFYGCSGLTSVTIPNSITSIEDWVFGWCTGLTSVTIPNSVKSIGGLAFYGCSSLTSIEIPNSVMSIGESAFASCSSLTSIIVENGNTVYDCRENCNAIIETSTNTLISGCKNTIIPNSITKIGNCAFDGCSGLTSVTIPNSVTSIGNWAFGSCFCLTSVTIPKSITSIGTYAFSYSGLTRMTIEAETPPTLGSSVFSNTQNFPIFVPCGTVDAYKTAWSDYASRIRPLGSEVTESASFCEGTTYAWPNHFQQDGITPITFSTAGIYKDTIVGHDGCDSICILHLSQLDHTDSVEVVTICAGEQHTWHGQTFSSSITTTETIPNAAGCDSVCTLHLTVLPTLTGDTSATFCKDHPFKWHDVDYSIAGDYPYTYTSKVAPYCDSIVTLHLTQLESTDSVEYATICAGEQHTWHDNTYSTTTDITETIPNAAGCDSVCTLHLTVLPALKGDTSATIITGSSFTWHGIDYSSAGDYSHTYTSKIEPYCDSIVTLHLTTTPPPNMTIRPDTMIQPGDSALMWATGVDYCTWSPENTLVKTSDNLLYAKPLHTTTYTAVGYCLSDNENVVYNGDFELGNVGFYTDLEYFEPYIYIGGWGNYTITDNVRGFWNMDETPSVKAYQEKGLMMVVDGSTTPNSIVWQQTVTVSPNTYYAFSAQVMSCWDSNVEGQHALLQFSVNGKQLGPIFHSPDQLYQWKRYYETWYSGDNTTAKLTIYNQNKSGVGNDYALDEIRFESLNANVVDTKQVTIRVGKSTDSIEVATICAGDIYEWHGKSFNETTTVTEILTNAEGADSICTLILTVLPALKGDTSASICMDQVFTWHGSDYSSAGDYSHTYTSKNPPYCDSIVTLHLTIVPLAYKIHAQPHCEDNPYVEFNVEVSTGEFDQLQFAFSPKAIEQHFRDTIVDFSSSPILIPNSARAGIYDVAISIIANNQIIDTRDHQFTLLYPSSVLDQHWDDFIGVLTYDYNGGYDFVGFQWYKNGQPIAGETCSYLHQPLEMGAAYAAMLEEQDGTKLMTCEIIATPQTEISIYPTLAQPKQTIQVHNTEAVTVWLYNTLGELIYTATFNAGNHQFVAPHVSGVYVLKVGLADGPTKTYTQKLIIR